MSSDRKASDYSDDSVGFNVQRIEKELMGKGYLNIKSRIRSLNGTFKIDATCEMIHPKVQVGENMAVLSYNLKAIDKVKEFFWNCTDVYQKEKTETWKIIHSHWSFTKPHKNH